MGPLGGGGPTGGAHADDTRELSPVTATSHATSHATGQPHRPANQPRQPRRRAKSLNSF